MAIRAVQQKRIPRGLFMLASKKHAGELLLVQVPKFESDIEELNRAVISYPKQVVSVAWHAHIRFLQQPVRDGAKGHERLLY
jgi:hypothetical protein